MRMSSVLCCLGCGGHVLPLLLSLVLLISSDAARINRSALLEGDVRSEVVDPNNRTLWTMFNLTTVQINRIRNVSNPIGRDETTQFTRNRQLEQQAQQRYGEIYSRITAVVSNQDKPYHETAGYPICNGETSSPLNWQQSNNVTLQFAGSVFQNSNNSTQLDSALLRLYKLSPATAATAGSANVASTAATVTPFCRDSFLESQIRITVSIVHQQKKKRKLERKKRICNTVMLNSRHTGWVAIDVKCALTYWAQQERAAAQAAQQHPPIVVGLLMIEVHDDEENQLLPGQYFQPPTCDQEGAAVPWAYNRSATTLSGNENFTMSRSPRLDVGIISSIPMLRNDIKSFKDIINEKIVPNISNTEPTTINSRTLDNLLDTSPIEVQQKEQAHHQHRHHHHHSQQQQPQQQQQEEQQEQHQQHEIPHCVFEDTDASQQSESQHHLRTHRNHHHHLLHHHHNHHKNRHGVQNED